MMRAAIRFLGKLAISLGAGVLMFVAWELWGTGFYTAHHQAILEQRLSAEPHFVAPPHAEPGPPDDFRPGPGDPVFKILIPKIDLNGGKGYVVVEGVGDAQLALGPGHYPSCRVGFAPPLCTSFPEVWPGEDGRVVVSGHRTTHLAPFLHVDQLAEGDKIVIETRWGRFTYEVTAQRSVLPTDPTIVTQRDSPELVLTTCDPPGSAAHRLITFARLV